MTRVATVAYLGPPGTFTEEAVGRFDQCRDAHRVAYPTVAEVESAVRTGHADAAVLALENSLAGSVLPTLDLLAFSSPLLIRAETILPITLVLAAAAGTRPAQVRRVLSHPHALDECAGFLGRHVPAAVREPYASTAASMAAVRAGALAGEAGLAGVGPRGAALQHGLDILADDIADNPHNATRFVLVGRTIGTPTGRDRTALVCFQPADHPGSLLGILSVFADRGIDLLRLESRPARTTLGQYCFLFDCAGHVFDPPVWDAIRVLRGKGAQIRVLGSYPRAD
ncbi:prephenate dehydratase [Dactylosporangium sp. AC04546]|uniref:prephenate dehydratase n=1 Tax=Dactylosporangium sp. AC04546 TaxID=2862460 RepID=UPI001EDFBCE8|nr:prephenate dehydratase [Dactylosporangium sp. AC04546]WVK89000.1 prephenate dehydratase [Dactylosporangium sp. AC04546]